VDTFSPIPTALWIIVTPLLPALPVLDNGSSWGVIASHVKQIVISVLMPAHALNVTQVSLWRAVHVLRVQMDAPLVPPIATVRAAVVDFTRKFMREGILVTASLVLLSTTANNAEAVLINAQNVSMVQEGSMSF
jgi:hypothetical protein